MAKPSKQKSPGSRTQTNRSQTPVVVPDTFAPIDRGDTGYKFKVPGRSADAYPEVGDADCIRVGGPSSNEMQFLRFPAPLILHKEPGPYTVPAGLLSFEPDNTTIFKYFFKGTSKEVKVRQIFFHTELTQEEQAWLFAIRDYCRWKNFPIHSDLEPMLLRICYYNRRKYGEKAYILKSYDHLKEAVTWRGRYFPFADDDPELAEDLKNGVVYWAARDSRYRPLLIIKLKKLPRNASPERFKKLVVFAFEWAIRYIFIPGLVETCTCLFDVRGIAVHSFPMSALSDMTNTLTRQYPFRLDRMFIINDSLFIQTVWQIAKQFLTEVQQQKMCFMRTGFEKELLKLYAAHHLEKEFGGTRPPIEEYYPFPLLPGPFEPGSSGPDLNAVPNCHEAIDRNTVRGEYWEGTNRPLLKWSSKAPEVFRRCNLPPPLNISSEAGDHSTGALPSDRNITTTEAPLVKEPVVELEELARPVVNTNVIAPLLPPPPPLNHLEGKEMTKSAQQSPGGSSEKEASSPREVKTNAVETDFIPSESLSAAALSDSRPIQPGSSRELARAMSQISEDCRISGKELPTLQNLESKLSRVSSNIQRTPDPTVHPAKYDEYLMNLHAAHEFSDVPATPSIAATGESEMSKAGETPKAVETQTPKMADTAQKTPTSKEAEVAIDTPTKHAKATTSRLDTAEQSSSKKSRWKRRFALCCGGDSRRTVRETKT